jgi:hypothetical protein
LTLCTTENFHVLSFFAAKSHHSVDIDSSLCGFSTLFNRAMMSDIPSETSGENNNNGLSSSSNHSNNEDIHEEVAASALQEYSRQKRRRFDVVENCSGFVPPQQRKKKQPRPEIQIPPRGIGPVKEPNKNDVLSGRGGRVNAYSGNVQFREIVQTHKKEYLSAKTKKLEKAHIAAKIVRKVRDMKPAGRFLKEDEDGVWYDIGDARAIKKALQALREDAPDLRQVADDARSYKGKDQKKKSSSDNRKIAPPPPVVVGGQQMVLLQQSTGGQASIAPGFLHNGQAYVVSTPLIFYATGNNGCWMT